MHEFSYFEDISNQTNINLLGSIWDTMHTTNKFSRYFTANVNDPSRFLFSEILFRNALACFKHAIPVYPNRLFVKVFRGKQLPYACNSALSKHSRNYEIVTKSIRNYFDKEIFKWRLWKSMIWAQCLFFLNRYGDSMTKVVCHSFFLRWSTQLWSNCPWSNSSFTINCTVRYQH